MNLSELDSLYAKSTPGTRTVEYNPDDHHDGKPDPYWYVSWGDLDHDSTLMLEADARFMAEIHNSYPALRDRLRALEDWKEKRLAELAEFPIAAESLTAAAPLFERPWFTAIYEGAMQFEWEDGRNYLEVEVYPDGTWRVLHVDSAAALDKEATNG